MRNDLQNIKKALQKNKDFFDQGNTRDVSFRLEQLKTLKQILESNEGLINEALEKDLGKSPFISFVTELGLIYQEINIFLAKLKAWSKTKKVKTSLIHFWAGSYIYREPYGTVLIFSPWNYPLQLSLLPLVGAIAAGNTVVLKPSELAPATAALMKKLLTDHFQEGLITVIEGDKEVSKLLLKEKVDYIFFTGSQPVGKQVMQAAAENLTPVTLELGGKSPCIVHRDANIDLAARRIVWGKYINCGQTCIAPDYLYVHEGVKEKFMEKATGYIKKFYGENPLLSSDYNRIINKNHYDRLLRLLNNGRLVYGGTLNEDELYISPTIIDQVGWEDPVMQEEIFGPILPILLFRNVDEVIEMISKQPKALALYVFSHNKAVQDLLIKRIQFGGGCINDTIIHASSPYLPLGGVGESGMGAYHGRNSFNTFTHAKSITKKSNLLDIGWRYPPYAGKLNLLKRIARWL